MRQPASRQGPVTRRRFLTICAAAVSGLSLASVAAQAHGPARLHRWRGIALGAGAEINLVHHDAAQAQDLFAGIETEIRRLEAIFSLYRPESELVRLNAHGRLPAPSPEMLDLLSLCRSMQAATGGAFDPTVQPLWNHYAQRAAGAPAEDFEAARRACGFRHVSVQPDEISFSRPGMAMTLNGIAQGFVTDRITEFMAAHGCRDMVVDIGEIAARGAAPGEALGGGKGWPVTLRPDPGLPDGQADIRLDRAAVASSARHGTTFDQAGTRSHILDPATGLPVDSGLAGASVLAHSAAVADGLSTAALVCGEHRLASALDRFPGARAFVVRDDGSCGWLGG